MHLIRRGQNADGQGKVETGPLLADVSRCHIDHKFIGREMKAAVLYGRHNPFVTLAHRIVRQSHQVELDPLRSIHVNGDRYGRKPLHGCPIDFDQHIPQVSIPV